MDILFPGGFSAWRAVSLGAITFGLMVWVWQIMRWKANSPKGAWKDRQALGKLLIPFFPLWLYGNLMILCANGLIGWIAGASLWAGDTVGKHVLQDGVGASAPDVTRSAGLALTNPGYMVVVLITTGVVAYGVHKGTFKGKGRWNLILPVVSGTCMGLSAGVAGAVGHAVGPGADTLGALVVGWI